MFIIIFTVKDKGENVWDHFTHTKPEKILNGSNADMACDSYHKYKEDVQMLKNLNVSKLSSEFVTRDCLRNINLYGILCQMDFYRFSLSWSRILPTGYANVVSKDGIRYYHAVLDELEKNNIEPLVTLYHWDHPQVFQELGGWTNEVMVDLFGDYARVVFKEFGYRIKKFATMNEPIEVCTQGLYSGSFPPGNKLMKIFIGL